MLGAAHLSPTEKALGRKVFFRVLSYIGGPRCTLSIQRSVAMAGAIVVTTDRWIEYERRRTGDGVEDPGEGLWVE
jgi:hypothetical protein